MLSPETGHGGYRRIRASPFTGIWIWNYYRIRVCFCVCHDFHYLGFEEVSFLSHNQCHLGFSDTPNHLPKHQNYRYQHEVQTSEMFSTAGRSVKSGLVAAAVVSSWTWAATLLQSTAVAYKYGVSGPFFYASGGCLCAYYLAKGRLD